MNLETLEKEIRLLSPKEFISFQTWFSSVEEEFKQHYLEELRSQTPYIDPRELLKMSVEERRPYLEQASMIATLSGLYAPDSEMMEWMNVGIDDGIEDE